VDLQIEELFTHNLVKTAILVGLAELARESGTGMALSDGMLLTNDAAALGTEPDAMYLLFSSFETGKVRYTAGDSTGAEATELVGSPDLVVEVVSPSSVDKDTEKLMFAYHDAGAGEYWLIDARGGEPGFDVYRHAAKGFVAVRRQAGWVRSPLFGKQVRMTRRLLKAGFPNYTLEIR
jgi:Uma2 family endonuclease